MITPSASINLFEKREITGIQDVDDLLSWPTTEFDSFLSISHNNSGWLLLFIHFCIA
jgi:hypothetical protein